MIIKLTVNNNDYGNVINSYFRNFIDHLYYASVSGTDISDDEIFNEWKLLKKLQALMNPNVDIDYTEEQDQFIIDRVKKSFDRYISKTYPESREYLMCNLEITILDSMEDKWENGESWYWFQHSDTFLNQ